MSKVFKVWLDSGANCKSCRIQEISLDEIGKTDEEWDALTEDEREEIMRHIAWDAMDWGYSLINDES